MNTADAARLVLLAAIWGSSYLFIKVALEGFTTLQIVAARLLLGAAVLVAIVYGRSRSLPQGARVWSALAVMALIANIIPFLLITWGETRISSSLAAILNSTTPLFTAVVATVVLADERASPLRLAGIVLGFAGVGFIVGIDVEAGSLLGQLAVVAAALSYACGFVFARRTLTGRGGSALALSAGQLLLGTLLIAPFAAVESIDARVDPALSPTLSLLTLGFVGTGIAYVIYYRLVEDVGATTASFVTYLIPIFGVLLGWIVLEERLGWNALVGAVLVIAGIALAEHGRRQTLRAAQISASDAV